MVRSVQQTPATDGTHHQPRGFAQEVRWRRADYATSESQDGFGWHAQSPSDGRGKHRVKEQFHSYPAGRLSTPFVPQGRATLRIQRC